MTTSNKPKAPREFRIQVQNILGQCEIIGGSYNSDDIGRIFILTEVLEPDNRDEIISVLREALEWYDNVHRKHWCIDLNDLGTVGKEALEKVAELVNK